MAETTLQPPRTMFAWSFDGIAPSAITKVTRRGVPITATAITVVLSIAAYAWAIYVAKNFFQVLVYATLIQLITHVLIAVSSISFPYRRTALYRASVATHEVAGIPLMVGIVWLITAGISSPSTQRAGSICGLAHSYAPLLRERIRNKSTGWANPFSERVPSASASNSFSILASVF